MDEPIAAKGLGKGKSMSDDTERKQLWRRFARGELSREDRKALIRNALSAAAALPDLSERECLSAARSRDLGLPPKTLEAATPGQREAYEELWLDAEDSLDRQDPLLEISQMMAKELFEELRSYSRPRQRILICEDPRFQSWPLCELLLQHSWKEGFDHPREALELAELAVSVAAELNLQASVPGPLLCDLKARAWAYLGNARRITSDLRGAEKAFELAESLVGRGSGDPIEEGRILELRASLALATHDLDEAGRLLSRANSLYRRAGSRHLRGRCRISQGLLWGQREEPAKAVECLEKGLGEIDSSKEPRLQLVAIHNLCLYLSELGRRKEALDLLARARELHQELAFSLDLVRLRWLEGRLALAAGKIEEAEEAFLEVREEFIQREIGYDVALVSLDLAGVYARQGRASEMRRLGEEMIPIFQARDLGREVMAALIVLQNATRMENVSLGLIEELSTLLEASRESGREDHPDA